MKAVMERNRPDAATPRLKKILVASDFSPAAANAFNCALEYQRKFGGQIHVLHVLEPACTRPFNRTIDVWSDSKKRKTRRELHASIGSAMTDANTRLVVRTGLPAHEIVQAARELDADLIVIATNGLTSWKHFCIGRTAEQVVRAAPCSVLVVREKERHYFC